MNQTQNVQRVQKVNGLLKKAFGKTTQGNLDDYDMKPFSTTLYFIAKGIKLPLLHHIIGQFPEGGDGSQMRILPRYESQAKNYAELYEKEFGKSVKITLDTRADSSTIGVYP